MNIPTSRYNKLDIAIIILSIIAVIFFIFSFNWVNQSQPTQTISSTIKFTHISDQKIPANILFQEKLKQAQEKTQEVKKALTETSEPEEQILQEVSDEYYTDDSYCEDYYYDDTTEWYNTDGLTAQRGVNYYDNRKETYYSSNVLYHQNTSNWTADDEGFYRTDEGYYVVAASDKEPGTIFEGSKGTCIVLDDGCDAGTTDYYVNW